MFIIRFLAFLLKTRALSAIFSITILVSIFAYSYTWAGTNSDRERNITKGKKAYKRYCSACHGRRGKGDGSGAIISGISPRDLTNKAYMSLLSDKNLFERIRYGENAFPYLQMSGIDHKASKKTIWDIVDYIRTLEVNKGPYKGLTPKEQEERFKDPKERGRIFYLRYCSACHGKSGDGKGWAAKTLEGTPVAHNNPIAMSKFTRQQIYEHVRGLKKKKDRTMPAFWKAFDPVTVKEISGFTKTLSENAEN